MQEIDARAETTGARSQLGGLGVLLILLAIGLAVNALLGPAFSGLIRYPVSQTVINQTIGLELFSLLVLAPFLVWVGLRALRGHAAAGPLSVGPAAFSVYMFIQYIIGPAYTSYPSHVLLHLVLFVLSAATLWMAWTQLSWLMPLARSAARIWATVLAFLAIFLMLRYVGPLAAMIQGGGAMAPRFATDATMYWTIFFLDLGILAPFTIAAAVALLQGARWGAKALHGIVGWFAFVAPSIAAMSIVMLWNNDPFASVGSTLVLVASAIVFGWLAFLLNRPMLRS